MLSGKRARRIPWPVAVPVVLLVMAALACNLTTKKRAAPGTPVSAALPSVVIQAPENGAQVLVNTDVLVYAVATDTIGVTRIELLVNNFVVASQASPNLDTGDTSLQVLLTWRPVSTGEQVLQVVPWRSTVQGQPASVTLIVRGSSSEITQTPAPTLAFITPTLPQPDLTCRAQIAVGALNVRTGPGLVYNVLGSATIGQEYLITGRQLYPDAWWQIFYNGVYAWVSGYYVNPLGDCSRIGIVLPPPTPTPLPNMIPPTIPPTFTPVPPTPTPVIPTLPPP
ncbi:MAG TPA: Ig-like domain-containing protein, partial [Aggregatilineaceae bacterium]|nr:Ig-like domain-containing protein [Aggregatilineaceae bacterium]